MSSLYQSCYHFYRSYFHILLLLFFPLHSNPYLLNVLGPVITKHLIQIFNTLCLNIRWKVYWTGTRVGPSCCDEMLALKSIKTPINFSFGLFLHVFFYLGQNRVTYRKSASWDHLKWTKSNTLCFVQTQVQRRKILQGLGVAVAQAAVT